MSLTHTTFWQWSLPQRGGEVTNDLNDIQTLSSLRNVPDLEGNGMHEVSQAVMQGETSPKDRDLGPSGQLRGILTLTVG